MMHGSALGFDDGSAPMMFLLSRSDDGSALGFDDGSALGFDDGSALGVDDGPAQVWLR